jgi:hypothetical protein
VAADFCPSDEHHEATQMDEVAMGTTLLVWLALTFVAIAIPIIALFFLIRLVKAVERIANAAEHKVAS